MHRVDCTSAKIKLSFRFARGRQNFKKYGKTGGGTCEGNVEKQGTAIPHFFFFSIITKYSIVSSIFICLLIVNMNLHEGGGGALLHKGGSLIILSEVA